MLAAASMCSKQACVFSASLASDLRMANVFEEMYLRPWHGRVEDTAIWKFASD